MCPVLHDPDEDDTTGGGRAGVVLLHQISSVREGMGDADTSGEEDDRAVGSKTVAGSRRSASAVWTFNVCREGSQLPIVLDTAVVEINVEAKSYKNKEGDGVGCGGSGFDEGLVGAGGQWRQGLFQIHLSRTCHRLPGRGGTAIGGLLGSKGGLSGLAFGPSDGEGVIGP